MAIEVQSTADLPVINRQLEQLWKAATAGVEGPKAQQAAFAAAVQERRSRVSERGNREHREHMESVEAAHKFTVAKTVNESRGISGEEAELRRKLGTPGWIPGDAFRVIASPLDAVKSSEALSADQIKSLGLLTDPRDLVNSVSVDREAKVRDWRLANGARTVDFVTPASQSAAIHDKLLKATGKLSTPDFLIDGYLTADVKVLRSFKKFEANVRSGALQAGTVIIDYRGVDVDDAQVFQAVRKSALNDGHKIARTVAVGKERVFFWEGESDVR
ncbi:hypothetical protein [Corynebacterium sp.]|uniref:hypothetical protein n=1 Tax=Corynebacterium sp. TaxID=1720 RepID=UPI0026DCD159|nr:hypothetical protein [Corynebacterium sp.]MDO5076398.1 hypothetical protein [Corynebacterium sp.]